MFYSHSKKKDYPGKEVTQMKRISLFIIAAMVVFGLSQFAYAQSDDVSGITQILKQVTTITSQYDAYGTQIGGTQSTVTVTQVTDPTDPDGVTTTESTQTRTLGLAGGKLVTTEVSNESLTTNPSGSQSYNSTTSAYNYNSTTGILESVIGSGELWSQETEDEGGQRTEGTIGLTYDVRNGQAVLISQSSSGTVYDNADGGNQALSTFSNQTSNTYEYRGGEWVTMSTLRTQQSRDPDDNLIQDTTTTTTYHRDELGRINQAFDQTRSGLQLSLGDIGPEGDRAALQFEIINYQATVDFDAEQGYYISSESYDLSLITDGTEPPGGGGNVLGDEPPTEASLQTLSLNASSNPQIFQPSGSGGDTNFWIQVDFANANPGDESFTVTINGVSANYNFTVSDEDAGDGPIWINLGTVNVGTPTATIRVSGASSGIVITGIASLNV